jgi:hypothetical protein
MGAPGLAFETWDPPRKGPSSPSSISGYTLFITSKADLSRLSRLSRLPRPAEGPAVEESAVRLAPSRFAGQLNEARKGQDYPPNQPRQWLDPDPEPDFPIPVAAATPLPTVDQAAAPSSTDTKVPPDRSIGNYPF